MTYKVTTIRPTDLDCPGCGCPAGTWCRRGGVTMPGSCHQRTRLTRAYNLAQHRGAAAGDAMFDGNSTAVQACAFIDGYNEGDPAVMDLMPACLSGEWAGESIPELFDLPAGAPWPSDDEQSEYENYFQLAFWGAATSRAIAILEEDVA